MQPSRSVRLAVVFRDYVDTQNPSMYHYHLVRHEDHGMVGPFRVVGQGQQTAR
ncbi:hypothetical protein [Kitasatospora sp. NPDC088346]|uniref:hypothetical protein n=1 Tax=Kitasatospora sp. NPDC088346 TaxID=3364073 RepID=UPI00382B9E34